MIGIPESFSYGQDSGVIRICFFFNLLFFPFDRIFLLIIIKKDELYFYQYRVLHKSRDAMKFVYKGCPIITDDKLFLMFFILFLELES